MRIASGASPTITITASRFGSRSRTWATFAACSASSANRKRDSELPATHSHSSGEFVG